MEEETSARKLTKKEKKALAFRSNKGKGKKSNDGAADQLAVPETDDLDDHDDEEPVVDKKKDKKRKREDEPESVQQEPEGGANEPEKKKKRQRGKKKSQRDKEAAANGSKLLLFVGNLPYKVTVDDIKAHFTPCGETPQVRLLTPKAKPDAPSSTTTTKSKGCAFIEFSSPFALQSALRLHESELQGRKINVELTAGGGGNSEQRKQKLEDKRKMMQKEREKVSINKKKKDIAAGKLNPDGTRLWGQPAPKPAGGTEGDEASKSEGVATDATKKKKVRDRRLQKDGGTGNAAAKKTSARAIKAITGANSIKLGSS